MRILLASVQIPLDSMFAQVHLEAHMYHLPCQMQPRAPVGNREAVVMEVEQQLEVVALTVQAVIQRSSSQVKHRPAQHNRGYQPRARNLHRLSQVMVATRSVLYSILLYKRWQLGTLFLVLMAQTARRCSGQGIITALASPVLRLPPQNQRLRQQHHQLPHQFNRALIHSAPSMRKLCLVLTALGSPPTTTSHQLNFMPGTRYLDLMVLAVAPNCLLTTIIASEHLQGHNQVSPAQLPQ